MNSPLLSIASLPCNVYQQSVASAISRLTANGSEWRYDGMLLLTFRAAASNHGHMAPPADTMLFGRA